MKRKKSIIIIEVCSLMMAIIYEILLSFFNLKNKNQFLFICLTLIIFLLCFGIIIYEAVEFYQKNKRKKWLLMVGAVLCIGLIYLVFSVFAAPWIKYNETVFDVILYISGISAFICLIGQLRNS